MFLQQRFHGQKIIEFDPTDFIFDSPFSSANEIFWGSNIWKKNLSHIRDKYFGYFLDLFCNHFVLRFIDISQKKPQSNKGNF